MPAKRIAAVSSRFRAVLLRSVLLLVLVGVAAVFLAGMAGLFERRAVIGSAPPAATEPRTAIAGVHLYEALSGGVSMQLFATSIAPAPGRVGAFLTWLRPVQRVTDARLVIDGPTGEQVIVTGKRCELDNDGKEIVFDGGALWERTDRGTSYSCRRIAIDHDRRVVAFQGTVRLQGAAAPTRWKPFELVGFFSDFPVPASEATLKPSRHSAASERS
ncbi:MAG: hypothetical protein PVF51_13150 [Nitrospirota bacterium]|jgi:hypothetical protein